MKFKYNKKEYEIEMLKWFPYIGNDYKQTGLIILGESHYEDDDDWQENNPETTQIIINKHLVEQKQKHLKNTEKVLLGTSKPSRKESLNLWSKVTYWNLVQRLMSSIKERPRDVDFDNGWELFFKMADILNPKYCLVLGKASHGRLGYYLNNNETKWEKNDDDFASKKKIINLVSGNLKLKIIFINHPSGSRGFNYEEWHELISKEFILKF